RPAHLSNSVTIYPTRRSSDYRRREWNSKMRRTISEHIHPPLMSVHSEHVQTFLKDYEHGTMLWVDLLAFLRRRSKGAGLSVLCLGWSPNQFVHSTHAEFSPNDFIWSHGNTDEPPMCNAPPSNQLNPDQDLAHRVIL